MIRHKELPSFVYDPSLVLYVPLWRRDGNTFESDDHYGHLATVTGATWGIQGRIFDGTDDKIVVSDAASLQIIGDITAIVWVKPTADADATGRRFLSKIGASTYVGEIELYRALTTGLPVMVRGNPAGSTESTLTGVTALATNSWVQIAVTAVGTAWKIYLNAVLDKSDTITQTVAAGLDLSIGARSAGNVPFPGLIGEVLLYNRALTQGEIQQNYLVTKWRYQ